MPVTTSHVGVREQHAWCHWYAFWYVLKRNICILTSWLVGRQGHNPLYWDKCVLTSWMVDGDESHLLGLVE